MPALVVAFACVLSALGTARGDRVHLHTGRAVEGLVTQASDTEVVVNVGVGSTRLKRSGIIRIDYSTPAEAAAIRQAWRRRYFLHDEYVPYGYEALARAFRDLQSRRRAAVKARRALKALRAADRKGKQDVRSLRDKLVTASGKLGSMEPADDVAAYNRLVADVNTLRADMTVAGHERESLPEREKAQMQALESYRKALPVFGAKLAQALTPDRLPGTVEDDFLTRLAQEFARCEQEWTTAAAPAHRRKDCTVVKVTVNDRTDGNFIVDTGAAVVTLSRAFADRADVAVEEKDNTVTVVMADGSRREGVAAVLKAVRVGDMTAGDIDAVILPEAPAAGLDGLLGMSFLRRFNVRLEAGTGRLLLQEFRPVE